jgi:hypothetical protein
MFYGFSVNLNLYLLFLTLNIFLFFVIYKLFSSNHIKSNF